MANINSLRSSNPPLEPPQTPNGSTTAPVAADSSAIAVVIVVPTATADYNIAVVAIVVDPKCHAVGIADAVAGTATAAIVTAIVVVASDAAESDDGDDDADDDNHGADDGKHTGCCVNGQSRPRCITTHASGDCPGIVGTTVRCQEAQERIYFLQGQYNDSAKIGESGTVM